MILIQGSRYEMNGEGQRYQDTLPIQDQPGEWDMTLQQHAAERAGDHFDLRLMAVREGEPEDPVAHSWAIRKGLPGPGQKRLAIQQPTHTRQDMTFQGRITSGYGKGRQKISARGKVDVLEASNDALKFNRYVGKKTEKYKMIRTGDNRWLMINYTPTHESAGIPNVRPPYKDDTLDNIARYTEDDRYVMEPKLDGAHDILVTEPGKDVAVYSYRDGVSGLIEHTPKMIRLQGVKGPKDLGRVVLRGEIWGQGLDINDIGSLLNKHAPKSRKAQEKLDYPLDFVAFDVEEAGGQKMGDGHYDEKVKIMQAVQQLLPISVIDIAVTTKQKKDLVRSVWSGEDHRTTEGVVAWPIDGGMPTRIVVKKTTDVVVHDIFPINPGAKKRENTAGGIVYAYEEDPNTPIGRLGTGFTHEQLDEMWRSPKKFIGQVAVVESKPAYKSGILRTPAFKNWHLDKSFVVDTPGELHKTAQGNTNLAIGAGLGMAGLFLASRLNLATGLTKSSSYVTGNPPSGAMV